LEVENVEDGRVQPVYYDWESERKVFIGDEGEYGWTGFEGWVDV
jgi:hypothetical protein